MPTPTESVDAFLGLGANLGRRDENVARAVADLEAHQDIELIACSGLYETAPVETVDAQDDYLNAAIHVRTSLDPRELLLLCLDTEARLGRRRSHRNAPRTIDIDLLLFGNFAIDDAALTVPHPRLHLRRFALLPLADLAADMLHPVLGKPIRDLLGELPHGSDLVTPFLSSHWPPKPAP